MSPILGVYTHFHGHFDGVNLEKLEKTQTKLEITKRQTRKSVEKIVQFRKKKTVKHI